MSRVCAITGKKVMVGNNVSHANNKTKRRFLPNLQVVTVISDILGEKFRLRLTPNGLKTIEFHGGLDAFLLKTSSLKLSTEVAAIKKKLKKKVSA